jgi:hypothetical protein
MMAHKLIFDAALAERDRLVASASRRMRDEEEARIAAQRRFEPIKRETIDAVLKKSDPASSPEA